MNQSELQSFLEEAYDQQRRAEIDAGRQAVSAWRRQHAANLDDYLAFLDTMQRLFGSLPRRPIVTGDTYLL